MAGFNELLNAGETEIVKFFYKVKTDPALDFIKNINAIAAQLDLNHSQLVCAVGFNADAAGLTEVLTMLGFKSHETMSYRRDELFVTDNYQQLAIDDVISVYSTHLENQQMLAKLRELLYPRLEHIEASIEKDEGPQNVISYRMEIHSIYRLGIADKKFAEKRIARDIGKYRHLANELNVLVEKKLFPASNFFFMETVSPEEKRELIQRDLITLDMIKNRLQNAKITNSEREMLEDFI